MYLVRYEIKHVELREGRKYNQNNVLFCFVFFFASKEATS